MNKRYNRMCSTSLNHPYSSAADSSAVAPKCLFVLAFLLLLLTLQPATAQRLLLKNSFPVPKAVATSQDVQGNLYLATPQGQVLQFSPQGKQLATFSPNEVLSISSLQALPGLQLLAFDKNNQQLIWIDRLLTQTGKFSLTEDQNRGFIEAVAAAEGNGLWLADASQQRLLKRQFPGGETLLSVPLNLVTNAKQLKYDYLREYKGKLYLHSPGTGLLVFDSMGNFEQTLNLPELHDLLLDEGRIYFLQQNTLGFLDLQTKELIRLPLVEAHPEHLLVKGNQLWLLAGGQAYHYILMPETGSTKK